MWISGSTASLVSSVAPDIVRSVQGETSQAQAGSSSPAARNRLISPSVRLPPALSPPTAMVRRRNALLAQEAPRRQRVLMRGRVGMLRRAAVVDRERAHPCRASGLRHHAAMADDRAGAISAAVEIQQHARRFAAGNERPFAGHAVAIDRLAFDIGCHRPGRSDLVEPLRAAPPSRPAAASNPAMRGWRRSRCEPRCVLPMRAAIIAR